MVDIPLPQPQMIANLQLACPLHRIIAYVKGDHNAPHTTCFITNIYECACTILIWPCTVFVWIVEPIYFIKYPNTWIYILCGCLKAVTLSCRFSIYLNYLYLPHIDWQNSTLDTLFYRTHETYMYMYLGFVDIGSMYLCKCLFAWNTLSHTKKCVLPSDFIKNRITWFTCKFWEMAILKRIHVHNRAVVWLNNSLWHIKRDHGKYNITKGCSITQKGKDK